MRYFLRAAAAALTLSAVHQAAVLADAPAFPVHQVAHEGHDTGLGSSFTGFGMPVINDAGLVGFTARFGGGFLGSFGLFTDTANGEGLPTLAARNGQAAPGTATNFGTSFGFPYLNDAGQLATSVFLVADGVERSAIYAGGAQSLSLLAREGHAAPVGATGSTWYPLLNEAPFPRYDQANNDPGLRLNHAGQTAFGGWIRSGDTGSMLGGLFIGAPGNTGDSTNSIQKVFLAGDVAPGTGGTATFTSTGYVETTLGNPHPYVLNDNGLALFRAGISSSDTGLAGYGIFTGSAGGSDLAAVALPGGVTPLGGDVRFASAQEFGLGINNAGHVAFSTSLQGTTISEDNNTALFAGSPDDLRVVYQENDLIPGLSDGARLAYSPGALTMNARGDLAFLSATRGSSTPIANDAVVMFAAPDATGDYTLDLVSRIGDDAHLTGDTYRFNNFFGTSLNAHGLLVFGGMAGGDATGDQRTGLWGFSQSDGLFSILATGQEIEVAPGVFLPIDAISFADGSGGEDGRRIGLNDNGELSVLLRFAGASDIYDYGIYTISLANSLPGDFNGDGEVSQDDLTLLLSNWGQNGSIPGWTASDQLTGSVDQDELTLLLSNWGAAAGASATLTLVPEPLSAAMATLLALSFTRRRSKAPSVRM